MAPRSELAASSPVIVVLSASPEAAARLMLAGPGFAELFGRAAVAGSPVTEALRARPHDVASMADSLTEAIRRRAPWRFVWSIDGPDGQEIRVQGDAIASEDASGTVTLHGHVRRADVSQSSRASAEDRERVHMLERRFRRVVDASPVPFALNDGEGRITYLNRAFVDTFGYTTEDIPTLHQWWPAAYPDEDYRRWVISAWGERLEHSRRFGSAFEPMTLSVRDRRGATKVALAWATSLDRDLSGEHLVVLVDITEQQRAQEAQVRLERQLLQAQKLESLGVLAGGIAHDFNNLLVAIVGNAELAMLDLPPSAPARESVTAIQTAAHRAAELARQMLAYSGRGKFEIRSLDLTALVVEMSHLLEVAISKKVTLRYNLTRSLPRFEGDATQVRQVLMNLITNASEAIGDGIGRVTVATGVMFCDESYLTSSEPAVRVAQHGGEPAEGMYVFVEVADTGCGMTRELISRIFDPFFTTKFTGRGLGLSAVLGIIRGHGGALKIYSEPGRGSTFKVLFPARAGQGADTDGVGNGGVRTWTGSGTILLADDEESIRTVARKILRQLGFDVVTARDGREALELFQKSPDAFVLVMLDYTMPHLDGEQTFRELKRIRQSVKVIVTSGYSEQEVSDRFQGKGLTGIIQKPFGLEAVRTAVKAALNADAPAATQSPP